MRHIETILWRRIDLPGHETAKLDALDDGWKLSGTSVFQSEEGHVELNYAVLCTPAWHTKSAQIAGTIGGHRMAVSVSVSPERKWYWNGSECRAVEGCIDIDLGFTPATNLLPIRRLALAVGEQADVRAAWLPFPPSFPKFELERPELEGPPFEVLRQVYRREAENVYHYESDGGAFVKTLEVNATGFVTHYPGFWKTAEPHYVDGPTPPFC